MANWRKTINRRRKDFFKALTRNLGVTRIPDRVAKMPEPIRSVLVIRPNHRLGNQLLITPLLQEIEQTLPDARVDLWVKGGVAPVLFRGYKQIDHITLLPRKPARRLWPYLKGWLRLRTRRYDLVINVVNHSSSGKISTNFANAQYRFLGDINEAVRERFPDSVHMAKYPVYSFRYFIQALGYAENNQPVAPLDLRVSKDEIIEGKQVLYGILKNDRKTIAIYTFATGDKMYSSGWWEAFYQRLKDTYPDHNILEVLPVENVSQIAFQAPSFYSTDLRVIAGVIRNCEVFIGADSGMMHLAVASGAPTVGLFKFANKPTYEPYGHGSTGVLVTDMNMQGCMEVVDAIVRRK